MGMKGEGEGLRKFILVHDDTLNLGHLDFMMSKESKEFVAISRVEKNMAATV